MKTRTFSELLELVTYEDRLEYLKLSGEVGKDTFGFDRYMNQQFYRSAEWKLVRDYVIARDNGCDLGIFDRPIEGKIFIHHMNPIKPEDIKNSNSNLLNPEYLITVSFETHNFIHYGISDENTKFLNKVNLNREKGDTCLWKKN